MIGRQQRSSGTPIFNGKAILIRFAAEADTEITSKHHPFFIQPTMTTDVTIDNSRSRERKRSPQSARVKDQRSESADASPSRGFSAMFPLGPKEGWTQWVSVFNISFLPAF